MKQRVVVYKKLPEPLVQRLQAEFELTLFDRITEDNRADFLAALKMADGMIGASLPITNAMLDGAPRLKIASTISVGVDNFDLDYFRQRGLMLAHTPGVLTEATADTIFALILATARRVVELADYVKAGRWKGSIGEAQFGVNVHGKTLGLIGMGRIGSAVARRARHGFGMSILYHNTRPNPEAERELGARYVSRDALLSQADFVCLMLPLTPATERMFGAREFGLMKRSAIFINASRGRIVDEAALIAALQENTIYGAGLDVFEVEPLPVSSPLLQLPNVVALPHIGSATHETRLAMAELAVANLIAGLRGEPVPHLAV
ncbi:bifunctional glyoxylate/hydroxypyruvate reductase B [Herbaspirillum rubrisubalbicans]|uniref:Bifunctional glyoxylate/hydroxypyruvate reductase B n=1 Tax=Herbaspirillum rubrisubalbicans TaxID=80842 RepID=A0ABX9C1P5_9BURK|nr:MULTISPECIES: D-glycerate dehydrogenase [Herbaspirillum]RAM64230.1 bifunctional glyoxylate/hydroxypyruvate reductase B [Herbaspirillum rubrisubalbicans]RAN49775.1 bifunctional glyoxylate/hydroxypyruvate reductase B [Herbaspirillum rubrisubalbicans]